LIDHLTLNLFYFIRSLFSFSEKIDLIVAKLQHTVDNTVATINPGPS